MVINITGTQQIKLILRRTFDQNLGFDEKAYCSKCMGKWRVAIHSTCMYFRGILSSWGIISENKRLLILPIINFGIMTWNAYKSIKLFFEWTRRTIFKKFNFNDSNVPCSKYKRKNQQNQINIFKWFTK